MRPRTVRRGGVLTLVTIAVLVAGVGPAAAAAGDASAYGANVNVTLVGSSPVTVGPVAVSSTTVNPNDAHTVASLTVPGILTTGVISTSVATNTTTGEVSSMATVNNVTLPVLSGALGAVTADAVVAQCDATQAGITLSTTLTNATLGSLGTQATNPAPNTQLAVTVPGAGRVATVTLNEQITNTDGSRTVNAMHVALLGGTRPGSIGTGDVIIGSATCGPAALPTPLASGAGLWLGLGVLGMVGVVAVPTRLVVKRRQHSRATT